LEVIENSLEDGLLIEEGLALMERHDRRSARCADGRLIEGLDYIAAIEMIEESMKVEVAS
jgi:hypothetical protein